MFHANDLPPRRAPTQRKDAFHPRRLVAFLLVAGILGVAQAGDPLHVEVDRLIAAGFAGAAPAGACSDAEFLRRAWLDFAGRIPPASETRAFLADPDPGKRTRMIDRLLAAPAYVDRMEDLLHVMLMERRGEHAEWRSFLRASLEQNQPWNQLARSILDPSDSDEQARGAAFFYTKRLEKNGENPVDYAGLTRDVGRLFLGVDLQCAECHDHLFVDEYKQVDFQGLFVVYNNLAIRQGSTFPAVDQQPITAKREFVSVFDPTQRATGPRIPFGREFELPPAVTAQAAAAGPPQHPEFDPLALLAQSLAAEDNPLFARNIANRLWFILMGRGLVMPLDLIHSDNPPSHPELLDLLANALVAHQFDVKWMLRELALTDAYQRSSALPDGAPPPPPDRFLAAHEKRLSAEQLLESMLEATGRRPALRDAEDKPTPEFLELQKKFVKAFANEPKEAEVELSASVKAALFLLNDEAVLALTRPHPDNFAGRLAAISDPALLADELFMTVYSRPPDDEERAAVSVYLEQYADRRDVAIGHLLWAMLSSAEFCANH